MLAGLGMSFNICRGTLGSLAMFTAIRNASSRDSRFIDICGWADPEIEIGKRLAGSVLYSEGFGAFLNDQGGGKRRDGIYLVLRNCLLRTAIISNTRPAVFQVGLFLK